eukprot:6013867-Prymnesium_polylepis.1
MTEVDLSGILPSATIMVVTVTATTTLGTPLPEDQLAAVIESCEQVLTLSENKQKQLAFVESRMSVVCPNLSVKRAAARHPRTPRRVPDAGAHTALSGHGLPPRPASCAVRSERTRALAPL